ncbi:DUF664 domain-containing protein [Nonomuraea diastatica]|nr:DUF664 domain-containing protein [Nonomuraea diastatica]
MHRPGRRVRGTNSQGDHLTPRWMIGHLAEEAARHNGQIDILRELIDGVKDAQPGCGQVRRIRVSSR